MFGAIQYLRAMATQNRQRDHGVTNAQLQAARDALKGFDVRIVIALRGEWAAETLDFAADGLERMARNADTLVGKPPK